ncbi:MAG: class flavin-dependent oxidoreductase [Cryobacterium sp.]|jgi:alkanesulfonate monooxygenase SsuD/methylene tetrahydromethanopterin reductase-like flavin-dependent oxidoreductase (luciferase family)|nr:class flavin-dependent oxidoreductase [Cryobacterium sp.]
MKFGIVTDGGMDGPEKLTYVEKYQQIVAEAVAAEQAGFTLWGTSETHLFAPTTTVSAPDAIMGAVAVLTSTLKLRYMTLPIPYHHPVQAAERISTLDVLSNGRVEVASARGNNVDFFEVLGIDASRTRDIWKEGLHAIAALLRDENVDFNGEFSKFKGVTIHPKLPTPRVPPLYSVATGLESHKATGNLGIGDMAWDGYFGWRYLEDCFNTYKTALKDAEPVGDEVLDSFSYFATATAVRATRAQALADVEPRAFSFVDLIMRAYGKVASQPSYEYYEDLQTVKKNQRDLPSLMKHGPSVMAGTPEDVLDTCKRLERLGVNEIVLSVDGISGESHRTTIEMFGKYIIPEFATH